MLCNSCKNKCICKHYEYFNNILINITVQVNECELYTNNNIVQNVQPMVHNPDKRPAYRQPLPSTYVDEEEIDENEERVYINMDNYDNEPKSATIVDLFMKGDNEDGKEDR